MSETSEDLGAVEQLLAERDALHGWLTKLDAVDTTVPEQVRTRVRADYQRRLAELTDGLRAHGDTIAAKLAEDRQEHADLAARASGSREALAEAELRHAVGEYSTARFEAERKQHVSDLETFEVSLAAAAERIARLEAVEELVNRAPQAPSESLEAEPAAPEEHPAEALEPEAETEVEVIEVDVDVAEESAVLGQLVVDDETDRLLAVFDEDASPADSTDDSGESAPSAPVSGYGPLSFTPSGAGEGNPSARQSTIPPLGMPPAASAPPRFVRPGERLRSEPPAESSPVQERSSPPARPVLDEEIIASGPPPEAVAIPVSRTLRCGECGAMNKPLEWYCEKCGAELTAS
jgi:hypothetical protein